MTRHIRPTPGRPEDPLAASTSPPRAARWLLLAAVAAAAFASGAALAQPNPLDTANAKVTEALQALKQAPAQGDPAAFEAHRDKAVTLLTRAQSEILKAKRLAPSP